MIKEIKKQIDAQTRPKVGNVRIDTDATVFRDQSVRTDETTSPAVTWGKTFFQKERDGYFVLDKNSFFGGVYGVSNTQVTTNEGNMTDTAPFDYANVRYSGWASIRGGGSISFRIISSNCSLSIFVDGLQQYSSGGNPFISTDINLYISDRSYIEIYWYAPNQGTQINITGQFSTRLSAWETADITPFFLPVQWYTTDPITTGSVIGGVVQHWIKLRWWFGSDVATGYADVIGFSDLGGFGIWTIDFIEAGEIDVINSYLFSLNGDYANHKYYRVQSTGEIIQPDVVAYTMVFGRLRTWFKVTDHGLSDGTVLEFGAEHLIRDIPFSPSTATNTTVYETVDRDLEYEQTYYYLIDTYDSSPNKNRGGVTDVYQYIEAGDQDPPAKPYNVIGTRSSYDAVTIEWEQEDYTDVDRWHIWEDFSSTAYDIISGSYDYAVIDEYRIAGNTGKPVSIEIDSVKYTRKIASIHGVTITFDTPLPVECGSGDTLRFLNLITSVPCTARMIAGAPDEEQNIRYDPT